MHGPSSTLRGSVIRRSQYTTQTSGSNMLCARSFPSFPKRKIWSIFVQQFFESGIGCRRTQTFGKSIVAESSFKRLIFSHGILQISTFFLFILFCLFAQYSPDLRIQNVSKKRISLDSKAFSVENATALAKKVLYSTENALLFFIIEQQEDSRSDLPAPPSLRIFEEVETIAGVVARAVLAQASGASSDTVPHRSAQLASPRSHFVIFPMEKIGDTWFSSRLRQGRD